LSSDRNIISGGNGVKTRREVMKQQQTRELVENWHLLKNNFCGRSFEEQLEIRNQCEIEMIELNKNGGFIGINFMLTLNIICNFSVLT
jgi:hypothetical protein